MNLEQLDGFFTALICCPDMVMPSEYLHEIWGGEMADEEAFADQQALQDFLDLVMRHWNSITQTLQSGGAFLPVLLQDEHGVAHANDWAKGFMRGVAWRGVAWRYATRTGSDSSTTRSGVGRKRGRFRFGLKHTPKIIDSEAGIPQESAKCAFRNLRVIGNDQPSIGWLIVAKDDVATSLPIDSIAKPTKDFYQLPTG